MKKLISLLAISIFTFTLKAQQAPETRAINAANFFKSSLHLTDQQTEKVKLIYLNQYYRLDSANKAIMDKYPSGGPSAAFTMARREVLHKTDVEIGKLLDKEQKLAFARLIENRRETVVITGQKIKR